MGNTRAYYSDDGCELDAVAMSVINQVLQNLEKRGAAPLAAHAAVRAVPLHRNSRALWLLAALSVLVLVCAGLWQSTMPQSETLPEPLPISAPATVVPPVEISVVAVNPESPKTPDIKTVLPAMRLSYELNTLPQTTQSTPKPPSKPNPKAVKIAELKSAPRSTEQTATVEKQMKQFSPQQRAENEFRRATELVQKGRANEALDVYTTALKLDAANNGGRQAMVWLLLERKRNDDAERVLQDGLKININNIEFATLLARLQVERNDLPLAMETLQKALPYAGQQAEYHAFIAAVYQRLNQHNEAITHYQIAVMQMPNSGIWLMGLGVSLHEVQRNEEARSAFKNAIETHTLSAELQAFVEQRLKELG